MGSVPVAYFANEYGNNWFTLIYLGLGIGAKTIYDTIGVYLYQNALFQKFYREFMMYYDDAEEALSDLKSAAFVDVVGLSLLFGVNAFSTKIPFLLPLTFELNLIIGGALAVYNLYEFAPLIFSKII